MPDLSLLQRFDMNQAKPNIGKRLKNITDHLLWTGGSYGLSRIRDQAEDFAIRHAQAARNGDILTLFWLQGGLNANPIDTFISDEIPDQNRDPEFYEIVTTHETHGPLNPSSPCMHDRNIRIRIPREISFRKHMSIIA